MTTTTVPTSARLSTPWTRVRGDLKRLLQLLAVVLSTLLVLLSVHPLLALVPSLYPLWVLLRRSVRRLVHRSTRNSLTAEHATRVLMGLLPALIFAHSSAKEPTGWIAVILVALLAPVEPGLVKVLRGRRLRCTRLPGVNLRNEPLIPANVVLTTNLLIAFICAVIVAGGLRISFFLALPLAAVVLAIIAAVDAFQRVIRSVDADNDLYEVIARYAPKFVLYYGVGTGSEYQVQMWIDYLERIGEPFIVVLRHTSTFAKISEMTSAPVVVRTSMRQLDDVVVPSVTTAFYVNNGALNAHLVRYPQITHVQLLHGDSDKATSYNPITGMFDKIFVAGQAGIDRYVDNGIDIPLHKFEIVGRPQVEAIEQRTAAHVPVGTVLYAPTWEGHFADTNYSSVAVAPPIIDELVRRGQRVIFRPHPYSYRNENSRETIARIQRILSEDERRTRRGHLWGEIAEHEMGVFDCFNAADAMISDVSSVVPDFLYSLKPFAMVSTTGTPEEFERAFPLAKAAYVIRRDLANLAAALDDLLVQDSRASVREQARVHYLGPFDSANYADGFVSAARALVLAAPTPATASHPLIDDEEMSADEISAGTTTPPTGHNPSSNHESADLGG